MSRTGPGALKSVLMQIVGWVLVLAGLAALALPGPGLLLLFAGLVILAQHYEWAARRVDPVKRQALTTASDSVQSWPRIATSLLGIAVLVAVGVVWGIRPPAPGWWPLRDSWWLLGGWGTGAVLIASGIFAIGLMVFSFRRFRGNPYRPAPPQEADGTDRVDAPGADADR